ncbi:CIS tube protein [Streptomyces sp. NRRL S-118]|uniref:CIS tube protein n=1 Tax=Streptomyces sp. NRRL S-118 TaxID=1463881 RepID=UPI0004C4BBBF|nr:LysM peptidoglycan-binding domain-containing protein [Streptomyces sp. NRRL S-118]
MNQPSKAFLEVEGSSERIECLFNPAELTISKSNSWQAGDAKGVNAPALRFQAGQSATLTLTLMFDTTRTGTDVTRYTSRLLDLLKVDPDLPSSDRGRQSGRPPWVKFHWGDLHSFRAVVDRLQVRFTYFASTGKPLRAKADMTLKQWQDEGLHPLQNPTSSTPTLHSVHVVRTGETLDRIAAARYRDPARWRLIAEANGIHDPLAVAAGTTLVIPEQPVRRRA